MKTFLVFCAFLFTTGAAQAEAPSPLERFRGTRWVRSVSTVAGQFLTFDDKGGAKYSVVFGYRHGTMTSNFETLVWHEGDPEGEGIDKFPSIRGENLAEKHSMHIHVISDNCLMARWNTKDCLEREVQE